MRAHHSKRALTLASALVAAGLALTSAPHALAADGDDAVMKLTSSQAEKLAEHMNVDVYGDQTAAGTDTDSGTDAATDSATDSGSGTSATTDDASVAGVGAKVTFNAKSTLEGVRGLADTVAAANGQYYTVNSLGSVQLHNADGSTAWARTNASLYTDWQVKPLQVWRTEPYPAHIVMGYNAVSPFSPESDQGYDTADLTGDGTPDIVTSAAVGFPPTPRAFTSPGSSLSQGTFVTVMDGKTGKTLWSKLYSYVTKVKVVDGTLVLANSPRYNSVAPASETATLTGIRFGYADGALTPSSTWTYDTKETRVVSWGALESTGDGKFAASWSLDKTADAAGHGTTVLLNADDGSVDWTSDSDLYGRQLHLDAARGRLVALEQPDSRDAVAYSIVAYDLKSGERTTLTSRENSIATALTVGDAASGDGAEYAVSEATLDENYTINASTIRVLKGTDGSTLKWAYTFKRDATNPGADGPIVWRLDTAGGKLVSSARNDRDIADADNTDELRYGALTLFNSNGAVGWRQDGVSASPMFHELFRSGDTDLVRTVDMDQNIHTFNLGSGKEKGLTPLQGDLNYGQAVDLNGDKKKDLVAGGNSDGVWAWSGPSLVNGAPKQLWRATVPGEVHNIATGDVNGDGKPEIVVAADTATVILDGATGKTLTTIDGNGQYVRSVTVADVNGDGKDEVLVPTDALRVYDARGSVLWSYSAPSSAGDVVFSDTVFSDKQVYTQYASRNALKLTDSAQNGLALNGKDGKVLWTADPKAPAKAVDGKLHGAVLDHGVFASSKIPYADGHAVVYTWIAMTDPTTAGDLSSATAHTVVEIRDGRTGEVLHTKVTGSPWSFGNYFIDEQATGTAPLYQMGFGVWYGFDADGKETYSSVVAPLRRAQFITGPGGRKLVAGGTESGLGVWDPSLLTTGYSFQSSTGGASLMGGRSYVVADLDGDGVDDMVSLNFDHLGNNRMAALLGGGVLSIDNAIHQMTTYTLS
ncbi:FG-GAP-like repeat-containing protein [Streptomyces sp. VRA16 Mangrove soil]|uniref:FG-GAP-like repeat-containing protein n=1 Tax=Streptomyces sp. VRA16 Mangrove soil TaxID=2817434 RepID=UPI001A9DE5A4|nr:FG-GAP-like repeat-containing protein [Streptomyces sp. VRA16 Mangrove soil]MBO1331925.1 VCBS repeat-containing protein [Streptomyces sp. VRA16 Mangrove soil]